MCSNILTYEQENSMIQNYSRNKCFPQYFTHRSTHYIEPAVHLPTRFNNCHPPLWLPPNCFKIQLTLESTQKSTRFWTSPSPLLWSDSLFQCTPPTWCYAARAPTLCSAPSWRPPCWGTTTSRSSTWSRSAEDPCSRHEFRCGNRPMSCMLWTSY